MPLWASFFFFLPSPSPRQLLMHLIYGTPAVCVCAYACVCTCLWSRLCGNAPTRHGAVAEGMLPL